MFQRRVTVDDVRRVLAGGETIERHPKDTPYPTRLVLGWSGSRTLHVVVADDLHNEVTIVITVYEPDRRLWDTSFRRRQP
jgi:hypothetical protein